MNLRYLFFLLHLSFSNITSFARDTYTSGQLSVVIFIATSHQLVVINNATIKSLFLENGSEIVVDNGILL